jgi:hypothetical protein
MWRDVSPGLMDIVDVRRLKGIFQLDVTMPKAY